MIKDFTDLEVWKKAHALVVGLYKMTKDMPKFEQYGLGDQMRRAAISITSNIAEGFGRQTMKEKVQFYYMASGSLTELRSQLYVASDVGYFENSVVEGMIERLREIHKMLYGLIRVSKTKI